MQIIYKAHGSNMSWAWLENISTCIISLRELACQVNDSLAPFNSSSHTTPDLAKDLNAILKSLKEDRIHVQDPSRQLKPGSRTVDVLAKGLKELMEKGMQHIATFLFV